MHIKVHGNEAYVFVHGMAGKLSMQKESQHAQRESQHAQRESQHAQKESQHACLDAAPHNPTENTSVQL